MNKYTIYERSVRFAARTIRMVQDNVASYAAAYCALPMVKRLAYTAIGTLIGVAVAVPILNYSIMRERYQLSYATAELIGPTNHNLLSKISYSSKDKSYYFNRSGMKTNVGSPGSALQSQLGGGSKNDKSLYSVRLATAPADGITYYDDNLGLEFSVTPKAKLMDAREEQGRLVYAARGGIQDIYTLKNNGLKDDIVLNHSVGNSVSYSYQLHLPNTLEARLIPGTGEVGIYSASPLLYNNINFGDSISRADVMKARKNGAKTHLVFVLPAPTIKEYNATTRTAVTPPGPAAARFALSSDGTKLTVEAGGLSELSYPVTIDPSVVTNSTATFQTGNDDSDIDYTTGNQITRGALTGGTVNASGWVNNSTGEEAASGQSPVVTYNGYMYQCFSGAVYYAPISSGAVGSWTFGSSYSTGTVTCGQGNFVTYNGYLYIINSASAKSVQYAQINASTGGVGSWTTASTSTTVVHGTESADIAYNGYLYAVAGYTGSAITAVTEYAPLNADGSVGTWTSSTSYGITVMNLSVVVNNGYIYGFGGATSTPTASNAVYAAAIASDGSLGAWNPTTSFTTARSGLAAQVENGYVYIYGGCSVQTSATGSADCQTGDALQDTQYAQINESGTLGPWQTTTSFNTSARWELGSATYQGYLYIVGGCSGNSGTCGSTSYTDIQYAQPSVAGVAAATSWSTATPSTANNGGGSCTVAYDGYIYNFGGTNGITYYTNSQYSALNQTTGNLGATWSTGTVLPSGRAQLGCAAANGYIYIVGGTTDGTTYLNDVEYATVNPTSGAMGAWTAATGTSLLPQPTIGLGAAIFNGYLYAVGGKVSGTPGTAVYYGTISAANGSVGAWTTATNSLADGTEFANIVVNDGYLYAVGGDNLSFPDGLNQVQYSLIGSSGAPGTWTASAYSFAARTRQGAAIWNGYLYVYGGWDTTTPDSDVNFAPLGSNGAPGTWSTTTSLPAGDFGLGYAANNGYLYEVGGKTSSYQSSTHYIQLNNGGAGIGSWTTASNPLTVPGGDNGIMQAGFVGYNGFLYEIGGNPGVNGGGAGGTTATSAVYYSPVGAAGAPGTWIATSSMHFSRANAAVLAYNGYMYAFGGYGSGSNDNVEYALICTGSNSGTGGCSGTAGTLGTWTVSTTFTDTNMVAGVGAVAWNGYLYVFGGFNTIFTTVVDYAPINANGSVGTWTATTSLPSAREPIGQVAVYNGYVYVVGGISGGGGASSGELDIAQINSSTHALGSFTALANDLPWQETSGAVVATVNGYIYLYEGLDFQYGSSLSRLNTFYAPIEPNGLLGTWQSGTSLNINHYYGGGSIYNGVLYAAGGFTAGGSGTYYADIQYATVSSIPRTAMYSKLIDLTSNNILNGITYTGTLNGTLPSGQEITYETAGSGATFSAPATVSSLGTAACQSGLITPSVRYIWLSALLDDSEAGAIFPDVDGSNANVTNITINYSATAHPTPVNRLHLGKTLQGGVQSSLDTCFP